MSQVAQMQSTASHQTDHDDSSTGSRQDRSILAGDFNYLLDREIQPVAFVPKSVLVMKGCSSTNHSSTSKSPLAAYTDSVDF